MATTDARRALLARLIDHAPLFPPASLPLAAAVAEDARARESASAFMLGRLVWPASRLDELPAGGRRLSVVLDAPLTSATDVESVEAPFRRDLSTLAGVAPEVFVEVSLDAELDERLDALAAHGFRAKVRCGGAAHPSVPELAAFVLACRERELVFKATAGLHRAVRSNGEHGFLNLLAAVAFGDEEGALGEEDADAFALDHDAFRWRNRSAGAAALTDARRRGLHSIGSCSFVEPVGELEALGVLPL